MRVSASGFKPRSVVSCFECRKQEIKQAQLVSVAVPSWFEPTVHYGNTSVRNSKVFFVT